MQSKFETYSAAVLFLRHVASTLTFRLHSNDPSTDERKCGTLRHVLFRREERLYELVLHTIIIRVVLFISPSKIQLSTEV